VVLAYVNRCIFAKLCAKNDFHVSARRDLDLQPFDLKIAAPVTPHIDDFSSKFECCTMLCFRVDSWHVTEGQTERYGRDVTPNTPICRRKVKEGHTPKSEGA